MTNFVLLHFQFINYEKEYDEDFLKVKVRCCDIREFKETSVDLVDSQEIVEICKKNENFESLMLYRLLEDDPAQQISDESIEEEQEYECDM